MNDTIDTIPMPLPGPGPVPPRPHAGRGRLEAPDAPDLPDLTEAPKAPEVALPLRFVGSGSEYFRIWIVNLLLTVLSLGLYYPYARARRLRYFHGATELDGQPLAFHGQARAMWRGYALVVLLFVAYAAAGQYSAAAGAGALLVLAALWPALWHASLRFRLANTGWRGLRARFTGSRAGAYAALAPLVVMALLVAGPGLLLPEDLPQELPQELRPDRPQADPPETPGWQAWAGLAWLTSVLPALALLPWAVLRLKRYQHGHYAFAGEQTRLQLRLRSLYAVYGAMLLLLGVAALLVGVLAGMAPERSADGTALTPSPAAFTLLLPLALLLVLMYTLLPAYHASRLQNLVWSGTHSAHLRFHSRLRFRALAGLTLKNALLVALTLGLYLPFAAVATARLRLQAVTVFSTRAPDQLVGDGLLQAESAAGDAAGDMMGVDLGL